jgi:hypothetical protein
VNWDKGFVFDADRMFNKWDAAKPRNQNAVNDAVKFLEGNQFGLTVVVAHTR